MTKKSGETFIANPSDELFPGALELLKQLIARPSFSKEENGTADIIEKFLKEKNIETKHYLNNVWAVNKYFDKKIYFCISYELLNFDKNIAI